MRERFTVRLLDRGEWRVFRDPVVVLEAHAPDAVRQTIDDVARLTRERSLHAVGFLTYEAAAAYGLPVLDPAADLPLAWFGLYEASTISYESLPRGNGYTLGPLTASVDRGAFERAFTQIKAHLAAGDTYQVNYTFVVRATFQGDAAALFADLCAAQRGEYSAYIDIGDRVICSASPELFFERRGTEIRARPMKGTAPRGLTIDADRLAGAALAASPKERAENVMVVDMIRNDLGRVAEIGSVAVPELFAVHRYPNVWQMTSLVTARSRAPLGEIVAAMHPCASITGAPKVRTMEILRQLELEPRGIYTGAIGHVTPEGDARFNVAIRTAVVDRERGSISFGIGSGIVWDSDPAAEYAECLLKGSILGARPMAFDLLETLRWSPDEGYFLLDRHLARLRDTAEYFAVPLQPASVEAALASAVVGATGPLRVRLLVAPDGSARTESRPHVPTEEPVRLRLACEAIDPADRFLYHKTTHRQVYERARAGVGDCDDVLLWNGAGEVTEATTANVIVEIDGRRVTPPVSSGLLAGTCRAEMLARREIDEQVVRRADLQRAGRLWVINSVHGMRAARLVD